MRQLVAVNMAMCALLSVPAGSAADWTRQFGSPASDTVNAVAADGTGVYAAGYTFGVLPGQTRVGGIIDAFLLKYDSNGNVQWTRQFGTASDEAAWAVAAGNNVYVIGETHGAFPGQTNSGLADLFLRKYDSAGNLLWTRQYGTAGDDYAGSLILDGSSIYIAGYTTGSLEGPNAGNVDAVLVKFDRNGNLIWARQFGTSGTDYGYTVAVDGTGVYVAGETFGALTGQIAGQGDAFLRKYDGNGNLLWTRQFGSASRDLVSGAATDSGGVYVSGFTEGALPGEVSAGSTDAFVRKYDAGGNVLWTRQFGTAGGDFGGPVAADAAGVYIAGSTSGAFPGQTNLGSSDVFVRKYDVDGELRWTRQFGSSGPDTAEGIAAASRGVYIGGYTGGVLPGQTGAGGLDGFLARLDVPTGLRLMPVTPCRVVDTRAGQGTSGQFGPPSMAANEVRSFPIPDGRCAIPQRARGYSLNVTVVPRGPLGYLTLWPAGNPQPLVSTLNSFHGGVVANAAILPSAANGAISAYVTNSTDLIIDINGYFVADYSPQTLSFYSLFPCRVVDTRGPAGVFGAPGLPGGVSRSFPLSGGVCGLPGWAGAYSLNVTVVPPGPLSYLGIWPTWQLQPFVSTLNSFDGTVVANAAVVQAGMGGAVSVFATNAADLVLDTNGYFGAPGNVGEMGYQPLMPCRVADTRTDVFGAPLHAGETRDFAVAGKCGAPSGASGYVLNVTVVPNGPLAYLTLWPAGAPRPPVSTLNSFPGRVVANAAIIPSGNNGSVSVFVTNETHVILDINGYFQ
ncbi:MAG: hypothetical protein IT167_06880 [Bryobacterales bacterium]|nr:hypothetical protein [Bryobacterales bacterium]